MEAQRKISTALVGTQLLPRWAVAFAFLSSSDMGLELEAFLSFILLPSQSLRPVPLTSFMAFKSVFSPQAAQSTC